MMEILTTCESCPFSNSLCLHSSSCHSGDLLPTFATAGYAYNIAPRDAQDVTWTSLQLDQWSSFARHGKPHPSEKYLEVRGYDSTLDAVRRNGGAWKTILGGSENGRIMSLGPDQVMVPLAQHGEQCTALGLPTNYISKGG